MSKAEEKSKQYRDFREQCGIKDPVMLNEIDEAYYEGYNQAEKDLGLTWEDIKKIYHLVNEVSDDLGVRAMYVNIYQETLKRFKERKGK